MWLRHHPSPSRYRSLQTAVHSQCRPSLLFSSRWKEGALCAIGSASCRWFTADSKDAKSTTSGNVSSLFRRVGMQFKPVKHTADEKRKARGLYEDEDEVDQPPAVSDERVPAPKRFQSDEEEMESILREIDESGDNDQSTRELLKGLGPEFKGLGSDALMMTGSIGFWEEDDDNGMLDDYTDLTSSEIDSDRFLKNRLTGTEVTRDATRNSPRYSPMYIGKHHRLREDMRDVVGRALYTFSVDVAHGYQKHLKLVDLRRVPIRIVWFHLSRDFRNLTGKWYLSGRMSDPEYSKIPMNELATLVARTLTHAIPEIRYAIGKHINIKGVPKVQFIYSNPNSMMSASIFPKSVLDGSEVFNTYKRDMDLVDKGLTPPEVERLDVKEPKPLVSATDKTPANEKRSMKSRRINAELEEMKKLRKQQTLSYHRSLWHYEDTQPLVKGRDVAHTSKTERIRIATRRAKGIDKLHTIFR